MCCEPNHETRTPEANPGVLPKHTLKSKLVTLAATWRAILAVAGGGGSSSINPPPPPPPTPEWVFVGNLFGNISGFSAAWGQPEPIPGWSLPVPFQFPSLLNNFAG